MKWFLLDGREDLKVVFFVPVVVPKVNFYTSYSEV